MLGEEFLRIRVVAQTIVEFVVLFEDFVGISVTVEVDEGDKTFGIAAGVCIATSKCGAFEEGVPTESDVNTSTEVPCFGAGTFKESWVTFGYKEGAMQYVFLVFVGDVYCRFEYVSFDSGIPEDVLGVAVSSAGGIGCGAAVIGVTEEDRIVHDLVLRCVVRVVV